MNALSLFSGIGGLDLAAEWAGFKTVAFCERDPFCQKVRGKHWPGVKIYDDVRTIDTSELPAIDLVFGGYPCQPFSSAGKRLGADDERHLWPSMLDIINAIKPTWVVGENVKGHISMGLDEVLDDLENSGFETQSFAIPAGAVKAPHSRERLFVVSYSESNRHRAGRKIRDFCKEDGGQDRCLLSKFAESTWWDSEPGICRVANGVPSRGSRLRSLGNAVVPQQAYPIFAAIAETYNAKANSVAEGDPVEAKG